MARSIDSSELRALAAQLNAAAARSPELVQAVMGKTLADVQGDAQSLAPVDTGNLRSSISRDLVRDDTSITGEVGPTAAYGWFVENGTSRSGPQPYMGPAFDRRLPALEAALGQIAGDVLG